MAILPLTRSQHLFPFASFLRKVGEPVERLLLKARLPANSLDDPETLIPSNGAFHFRELASQALGLPSIAIDATRDLEIADLGDFGRALFRAPTLYRLLLEYRDLINTQTTMATIEVETNASGDVSFCHTFDHIPETGVWHSDVYILQWSIKAVRLADLDWSPTKVWSVSPDASDRRETIEQLGAETINFGRHCTGFMIPSSMLALPVTIDEQSADQPQVNDDHPRGKVLAHSYSAALGEVIKTYAIDRWLSIEEAGEVLGCSVRTIQRRLREERTDYSKVVEDTRAEIAGELLETTDATIADISKRVGYRNQGNFTRAFRRWAGVTPRQHRQQRKSV